MPCSCFVAGTLIYTEHGLVAIDEIAIGDKVWAQDPETNEAAFKLVSDTIVLDNRIVWKLMVENIDRAVSEMFSTTDNHPWWVPGSGWIETKDLVPGMNVITKDGEMLTVADVTETEDRAIVYNLTVDGLNTYFVGKQRVLVHNCKKVGNLPKSPTGPGSVPKSDRDPKRKFTPKERVEKRSEQGGKCATGCGTDIDQSNSRGHHVERHADGGPTTKENHAEVCTECHAKLHAKD